MKYLWGILLIGALVAGCGDTPATRQTAGVNKDVLSVQEADNALGQPTGNATASVAETPSVAGEPASNMVVNNDAGPLVDQAADSTPAAEAEPAGIQTSDAGDKPDDKSIQQALKNLGLYDGDIDGVIGPRTKEAIRAFQRKNNLEADGKVGPLTWALLKTALEPASASSPKTEG